MSRLALWSCALALVCGACESTSNYEPPQPGALAESEWRGRIHMSEKVKNIIAIEEDQVFEARQNGLLRVQVNMRNLTEGEQSLRTSIVWFDASGLQLHAPTDGWMSHIVRPKALFMASAGASNPDAVSWRMNVDSWSR